jgi:hypothetical protein
MKTTTAKIKIGLLTAAVSIGIIIGMTKCCNNAKDDSSETLIEITKDSNNASDSSSEALIEIPECSENADDSFFRTKLPKEIRIEYFKESKIIDDYDAEITEIERLETSAVDKVEKAKLKDKKRKLIREREELAKHMCEEYEDWQYRHRDHRPEK